MVDMSADYGLPYLDSAVEVHGASAEASSCGKNCSDMTVNFSITFFNY
jgi:hypothetical protein